MKNLSMIALAVAALLCATSCDKDNDNNSPSTLSRLQAKWGVQGIQLDFPGTENDENYAGTAADYMDFRADNKVYTQLDNDKDTLVYSLVNSNTLVIDGDTAKISQLSNSQLVITETFVLGSDTSKAIYNLKK